MDEEREIEEPCYHDGCSDEGDYACCDDCGRAMCALHVKRTSRYLRPEDDMPVLYLCFDCFEERREAFEQKEAQA